MAKPSLGNIKVGVRVRPLISRELSDPSLYTIKWRCQENKIVRMDTEYCREKKLFEFGKYAYSTYYNINNILHMRSLRKCLHMS
jgi:hypothetical protein